MKENKLKNTQLERQGNKIYIGVIVIFIAILCINLTSSYLGAFAPNSCVDIKTILNSSQVNISSLSYPNLTTVLSNVKMSKIGKTFNYTFCNTSTIGLYIYDYYDELGNTYENNFRIGSDLSVGQSIMYIIFLLGALVVQIVLVYGSIRFPWGNAKGQDNKILSINNLKYVKILFISLSYVMFMFLMGILRGITSNFIPELNIQGFFETIYTIMLSFLFPLIVISVIIAFISFFNDKRILKMFKRGFEPE